MAFNAYVLDWTLDDGEAFRRELAAAGFDFIPAGGDAEGGCHIRAAVPFARLGEFAALCQAHLNAPHNYVDIQYPQARKTAIIFQQETFVISSAAENERVRAWAIAQGLPPEQSDWGTSF